MQIIMSLKNKKNIFRSMNVIENSDRIKNRQSITNNFFVLTHNVKKLSIIF